MVQISSENFFDHSWGKNLFRLNIGKLNPVSSKIGRHPKNCRICTSTSWLLNWICWNFFSLVENSLSNKVIVLCAKNFTKELKALSSRDFCKSFQRFLDHETSIKSISKSNSGLIKHFRVINEVWYGACNFFLHKELIITFDHICYFVQKVFGSLNLLNHFKIFNNACFFIDFMFICWISDLKVSSFD